MIKARHTLIYGAILVALGSYYYYFEVLKPQQKQQSERSARKVFQGSVDQINALEIMPHGKPAIHLVKEPGWQINQPIQAEVDEPSLNGLLNALESLQRDRQVTDQAEDLKLFGLQEPALTLRFKSGDSWNELLIGDQNPVGDARYAKTGASPTVFLIARGNWPIFDKEVKDLRRRQLFSFDSQDVKTLEFSWSGSTPFAVVKDGTGVWKSPDHADKVIKKDKVDKVLDQIQWLRARDFLAEGTTDLQPWGLDSPYLTIKLQLGTGQDATLRLAQEDQTKKQVAAIASQLGAVVQVDGEILKQLPKGLHSLEDRSLLGFKTDQVKQVIWQAGDHHGQLVRAGDSKWTWKLSDGKERELNQSWLIRSLLWELDDAEYEQRTDPAQAPAGESQNFIEFWGNQEKLGAISWQNPGDSPTTLIWLMPAGGGNPTPVQAKTELVQKVAQRLSELDKNQSQPG